MRVWIATVLLCACGDWAAAQVKDAGVENLGAPSEVKMLAYTSISFSFTARSADSPAWEIDVKQDLSGTYRAKDGASVPIIVSAATMKRLGGGDSAVGSGKCETKQKNIAQTGSKSITYVAGDASSRCVFNYSDEGELNAAAAAFQAIAQTMQAGEKLKHDHRFDRLGLDADLDTLTAAVKDGYAIELQNIAAILRSIVEDDEVLSASRRKAKGLLDMASVQAAVSAR